VSRCLRWALCLAVWWPVGGLAGEASTEDLSRADALLAQGFTAFEAGRFVDAAAAFEQAHALVPDPLNLRNIGRAYEKAERPGLALLWLERHLSSGDTPARLARSRADRTRIAAAYLGALSVECPPAAQVILTRVGEGVLSQPALGQAAACPLQLELEPGRYRLAVSAPEHTSEDRVVAVQSGQVAQETVALVPIGVDVAAPTSTGWRTASLATGGALMAAGAVLHALNSSRFADLEKTPNDDDLRGAVDATAYGALGAYAVGGALLVTGATLWLTESAPGETPSASDGAVARW
jgi:hypothetical protein